MLIAAIPLRSIIASKRIYLVTLLRLLLIPLALLVLIKLIGFIQWAEKGEIIVLISFLATTSPSAATVTQMAVIYNNNPQKASAIYGVTTLLCMFTMPLVIALYQMWGKSWKSAVNYLSTFDTSCSFSNDKVDIS